MVPDSNTELSLGAGRRVPIEQVDKILFSGVVVLKSGERLRARRSFKSLAQDWQRLRRLVISRQLATISVTHPDALSSLSTRDAAEVTGYPASRLRRLIRDGQIEASKVSGRWVIDPGSLYLWVAEHT